MGERQTGLVVDPCHADLSADVAETATEIVVEVTARNADHNDCAPSVNLSKSDAAPSPPR